MQTAPATACIHVAPLLALGNGGASSIDLTRGNRRLQSRSVHLRKERKDRVAWVSPNSTIACPLQAPGCRTEIIWPCLQNRRKQTRLQSKSTLVWTSKSSMGLARSWRKNRTSCVNIALFGILHLASSWININLLLAFVKELLRPPTSPQDL